MPTLGFDEHDTPDAALLASPSVCAEALAAIDAPEHHRQRLAQLAQAIAGRAGRQAAQEREARLSAALEPQTELQRWQMN